MVVRVLVGVAMATVISGAIALVVWQTRSGGDAQTPSRRDLINGKHVANGYPTVSADEYATSEASRISTPTPSLPDGAIAQPSDTDTPVPFPDACGGPLITGGQKFVDEYGALGNCGVYGTRLIISTLGGPGGSGIGIYECAQDDKSCVTNKISTNVGSWEFHVAPRAASVRILFFTPPMTLVISNGGQMCFDFATFAYSESDTCR